MTLNRKQRFLASIISGTALFLAFPHTGSLTPLIFLGFIPLLVIEEHIQKSGLPSRYLLIHSFVAFLIFNIGTSWWIWNADPEGAIFAFLFNTVVMTAVFQAFHFTRKHIGSKQGYLSFPFYWIGFEYLHNHWEFAHPWLTLGNTFSIRTSWIQWYEYTGVSGGTLWVLTMNILCFRLLMNWKQKKAIKGTSIVLAIFLITPLIVSFICSATYRSVINKNKEYIHAVIVQPNVDPYNEKFEESTFFNQNQKILKLAGTKVEKNTDLILAPETAISGTFLESRLKSLFIYPMYRDSLKKWNTNLLIGASTMVFFNKKHSNASRTLENGNIIEYYNTSLLMSSNQEPSFIHKSKLVPGVEQIPYAHYIPFLETLAIENGGIVGSLGIEDSVKIMQIAKGKIAPIVCYESVFSEFVAAQTNIGAQLLCVITNDGWWGDTPGYKQHFSFARLRAIENRRWLIRSANTGKSGVIDPTGKVIEETKWWEEKALAATVELLNTKTIYATFGDYLGRSSAFLSVFIFIFAISKKIKPNHRKNDKKSTK
ncbi:MAG: apolipoprotein N-acyltransferase [Crocinitomicaceae bacterium]|tara:strand:+ start:425 stop:2044 length:1620 start_codon:yes stop_codon:yes gene_type:complete